MTLLLDGFSDEQRADFFRGVLKLLTRTRAFTHPRVWPLAVVVIRPEEKYVSSRVDVASFFRAADLPELARECLHRRVPYGCVLCWIEADNEEAAGAGFAVIDLARELQAIGGSR